MGKFLPVLRKTPLFAGIAEQDMEAMLDCLGAVERKFSRGEAVFRAGEPARWLGVVLSGRLQVCREDRGGPQNRALLGASVGHLRRGSRLCRNRGPAGVGVGVGGQRRAAAGHRPGWWGPGPSSCTFHSRLVTNLLSVLAGKNILLSAKLEHVVPADHPGETALLSLRPGGQGRERFLCHSL